MLLYEVSCMRTAVSHWCKIINNQDLDESIILKINLDDRLQNLLAIIKFFVTLFIVGSYL